MESFEKFVRAFLNGEIEAYLKSEDVPADNSGPVKVWRQLFDFKSCWKRLLECVRVRVLILVL